MRKASLLPRRILLVDDNQFGNVARRSVLEAHGFQVETALSGEEALEMFLRNPFDLVVTDLKMHSMNGIELILRIRESGSAALTVLLSGWAGCLGLTEESTGADAVLAKSNKEEEQLPRVVHQLLARRARRKPAASQKTVRTAVARSG